MPCTAPVPRTVSPSGAQADLAAHRGAAARAAGRPGWALLRGQPGRVTAPPVTSAAAKNGAAPERSGSMSQPRPASRPGSTAQTSGVAVVDRRRRPRAASARSSAGAARSAPAAPRGARTMPRSKSGAASSSPETSWLEADASMVDLAAARPGRRRARSAAARRSARRRCRRRARAAPRAAGASGRLRACGSPSKVTAPSASAGDRRQEAHHRAGQADVDVGRARAAAAAGPPTVVVHGGDVRRPSPRRPAGHQLGVAGAQRAAQRATGPTDDRAEHQGPGGHRLGPGQPDRRRDRVGGGRGGPRAACAVTARQCAAAYAVRSDGRRGRLPTAGTAGSVGAHVRPVRDDPRARPT